jgi:uncharacterized LabA/DUF88 family protein
MNHHENNYAFIDSQNLNLSIKSLGWTLDFKRFRVYLKEKYHVTKAFLFIGYIEENSKLYARLQEDGFICIFKPTLLYKNRKTKGNCDAELVMHTILKLDDYDKAIIVSGDGDFYCLIKYLLTENKLGMLFIPNQFKFSALLKSEEFKNFTRYIDTLKSKLEYKKKRPQKDGTLRGDLFHG